MKDFSIRSLVFTALFSALFIVLSLQQMKLTISPIPFTFQTFAVIAAGIFLKPKQAFMSILAVIIIGALGLPVFGGKSGIAHILGPTGGYLIAFTFCAMFISIIVGNWMKGTRKLSALNIIILYILIALVSVGFVHAIGVIWMMVSVGATLNAALANGSYPFIIGDLIKALIGLLIILFIPNTIKRTRM